MNNRKLTFSENFGLLACALIILWPLLYVYYLHFDGAGMFSKSLLVLALIVNAPQIFQHSLNKATVIYWILVIYMTVNGLLKNGQAAYPQDGVFRLVSAAIVAPAMMMLLIVAFKNDFIYTLKFITVILWIYVLLFTINTGYVEKGEAMRFTGDINANEAALAIFCCFVCQIILFEKKKLSLVNLSLLSIPLFIVTLMTGSRMAFLMFLILIVLLVLDFADLSNKRSVIRAIVFLVFIAVAFICVSNFTTTGERLMGTTDDLYDDIETGTVLDYLGDRGIAYYMSWQYFLDNPMTGIGFENWRVVNPLELRAHSEYMVMYVENGLIAFVLYILFIVFLFKEIKKNPTVKKDHIRNTIMFSIVAVLYANFVLWTHNEYPVFILYSMAFAINYREQQFRGLIQMPRQFRC